MVFCIRIKVLNLNIACSTRIYGWPNLTVSFLPGLCGSDLYSPRNSWNEH